MTQETPSAQSLRDHDIAVPDGMAVHLPSLLVAVIIMLVGSVYPLLFAGPDGKADHGLATALFWGMSAGFVRGVGFVPRAWAWRLFFRVGLVLRRCCWRAGCDWGLEDVLSHPA